MRKLWNALRHGDRGTKIYLYAMLVNGLACLVFFLLAAVNWSWVLALVFLFFVIVEVIIWQSRSLQDEEYGGGQEKDFKTHEERRESDGDGETPAEQEENAPEVNEQKASDEPELMETASGEMGGTDKIKLSLKEPEEPEKPEIIETVKKDFSDYSKKEIVRVMHKYRVKRVHKTVMIDSSRVFGISQCPAYLWKDRKYIYLLLLEDQPRKIRLSIHRGTSLGYVRGVPSKPSREYEKFHTVSLVASVFEPFLPTYYQSSKDGVTVMRKNLYVLPPDIKFTNTSMPNVFAILGASFHIEDEYTNRYRYNDYFIEGYKFNVLWRDSVMDTKDYKDRIRELLMGMAKAPIAYSEFEKVVNQFIEERFITEEYAEFYLDYCKKCKAGINSK